MMKTTRGVLKLTRYSIYLPSYYPQLLLGIQYSRCCKRSFFDSQKPRSPMHNIRRIRYTMCQSNNTHLSIWAKIYFWNKKTSNFEKDILISPLPIHYSLRIYKWKWIESLDISLESLRLVCGLNIVNYPKHIVDFLSLLTCICIHRYIFQGFDFSHIILL